MAYLTFNEGFFSDTYHDIKNRVSSNIDNIKTAASNITGNTLGAVKNIAVRAKNLANDASEGIHNFGNKIGAAGFEDDKSSSELHKSVGVPEMPDIGLHSIKNKILPNKAAETANAYHNLKAMGLAGSREEINKAKYEKLKQEDEMEKLKRRKEKYGY